MKKDSFGRKLRTMRMMRGESQKSLAKKSNVI
jgi:transcriptional regulator with XRE-family HTH domain